MFHHLPISQAKSTDIEKPKKMNTIFNGGPTVRIQNASNINASIMEIGPRRKSVEYHVPQKYIELNRKDLGPSILRGGNNKDVVWRLKSLSGKGLRFDALLAIFDENGAKSNGVKKKDLVRVRMSINHHNILP
nr:hypothetical protein [Tanacetum cinerariifolium]